MVEIDFSDRSAANIVSECQKQLTQDLEPWEQEVYQFVRDWYNDSPFVLAHTSGSTGTPKPIQLDKKRMEASAKMTGRFLNLQARESALLCLPIRYIAGKMMVVRAATLGLNLVGVKPQSSPLLSLSPPIDFCAMVPNQVFASMEELGKVKNLLVGGGPLSPELEEQLSSKKGNIYHTYGMTETITHVALRRINQPDASDFFEALPGVNFQVDKRECLLIDAPHLLAKPLITNDRVELLDSRSFVWKGRFDNVVISGGVKVQPEEVERVLGRILEQRFFVAGLPDAELGKKLVLVVEGDEDLRAKISHQLSDSAGALPPYHLPREVFFLPKFPETNSGKVRRKQILDRIANT